jgi:hypothetical protein
VWRERVDDGGGGCERAGDSQVLAAVRGEAENLSTLLDVEETITHHYR